MKDFLAAVMATKTCSVDQLFTMTRNATPNILVNVQEAGSAQVDTAHQTVMKWKGMLSAEEWDDMWVIVVTSHSELLGRRRAALLCRNASPAPLRQWRTATTCSRSTSPGC